MLVSQNVKCLMKQMPIIHIHEGYNIIKRNDDAAKVYTVMSFDRGAFIFNHTDDAIFL